MAEEENVHIVSWPAGPAGVEHHFVKGEHLPVSIAFDPAPAHVVIGAQPHTLAVDMNMALSALESIPVCISLCEPICAESDYTIGISIFDRPVMTINLRGKTRIYGCREEL